jgi:hypothetical protein
MPKTICSRTEHYFDADINDECPFCAVRRVPQFPQSISLNLKTELFLKELIVFTKL